jgi:PhnB protein
MEIQPYLYFDGRCEEALQFYQRAVGAEVQGILRMKEAPGGPDPAMVPSGSEDKVMHAAFRIGDTTLLASDGRCQGNPTFQGISLTLVASDAAEAGRCFRALSEGGEAQMPLGETFFSPCFGTLVDRFGVSWMIYVPTEPTD